MDAPEGEKSLEPLSVVDCIGEAFRLYGRDFRLFLGIGAALLLPPSALVALAALLVEPDQPLADRSLAAIVLAILGGIGLSVANVILPPARVDAVGRRYFEQPREILDSAQRGLHCFWRVLKSAILIGLVVLAILIVPILLFVFRVGGLPVGLAVLFAAVGVVIWLGLRWSMVVQVIVVEDTGALGAIERSAELTSGSILRVLGLGILLGLILLVVIGVPQVIGALVLAAVLDEPQLSGAAALGNALLQAIAAPLTVGPLTLLYFDLRLRKNEFGSEPEPAPTGITPSTSS